MRDGLFVYRASLQTPPQTPTRTPTQTPTRTPTQTPTQTPPSLEQDDEWNDVLDDIENYYGTEFVKARRDNGAFTSNSVVVLRPNVVLKIFRNSETFQKEFDMYNILHGQHPIVIPEFTRKYVTVSPAVRISNHNTPRKVYDALQLDKLTDIPTPGPESAHELKTKLGNVLEQLWDKGIAHNDVVWDDPPQINLNNFKLQNEDYKLIDFEKATRGDSLRVAYEKDLWRQAKSFVSVDGKHAVRLKGFKQIDVDRLRKEYGDL